MEANQNKEDAREGKMYGVEQAVEFQSVTNTFRLCYPAREEQREWGYIPLRLGVKTVGIKSGFYHELLANGCTVKVSSLDLFRYLWQTRNQITFEVFSQN